MSEKEQKRLNEIAADSTYSSGVNEYMVKYSGELFLRNMTEGSVLEMGPAEGVMTDILIKHFDDYTVVDGAKIFIDRLKERYPNIHGEVACFEDFEPGRKFNNIILGHVLEHVENPVGILEKSRSLLIPGGYIIAAVPNCNSIHRQAAVKMGLLSYVNELNEADLHHGHRRVYSYQELISDFRQAGLNIKKSGGYWLKPLSNRQIEENWTEDMIRAFMELGEQYPDIAAEIYIVAEAPCINSNGECTDGMG